MANPRNPWPGGIVIAFVLFVLGTTGLIVLACTHQTELVRPDYYEQELRYQGQLERVNRTKSLGDQVSVAYDAPRGEVRIHIPADHARRAAQGQLHLYRPSAAGLDRRIDFRPDTNGVQTVDAAALRPGLWRVRVTWTAAGEEYFTDQGVVIQPKPGAAK
jgi:hypothetical protein